MDMMQWYSKYFHANDKKKCWKYAGVSSLRNKPVTSWPELHRPEVTSLSDGAPEDKGSCIWKHIHTRLLLLFITLGTLTWSAKTGPFCQHFSEDLLTSSSNLLFEVCNITDTGSLLGLLQLLFWIFSCLISSMEKPSHVWARPQRAFI